MLERLRGPRDERGVVAVVVALVTCFMLIPIAAFAVDLGVQRVARTDAQSVADVVALDLSRQLDGRTYAQLMSASPSMQNLANKSAARSSNSGHGLQVALEFGVLDVDNFDPTDPYAAGYFTPITSGTPDAVRVRVSTKVGFTFIGGSGGVTRTAIGNAAHRACVTMDSYAAAIDSGNSAVLGPLNTILGTNINTAVLSSSGILDAQLDVLEFLNVLKTNLGVGSVDEVLSAHVTAAQIVAAEVAALNASGASAVAQALQSQVGVHINSSAQVLVSDVVGITQGGASAIGATLNPLDLAAAAVQVANGTSAVSLAASGANLIGLTASATVGSKPKTVCLDNGRQQMEQTSVDANAKLDKDGTLAGTVLNLTNGLTGVLGNTLCGVLSLLGATCYSVPTISDINLTAHVGLAQAAATVTNVTCTNNNHAQVTVLEQSKLAPATVTLSFTVNMKKTYHTLLGVPYKVENLSSVVTTTITTDTPADQATTATFDAPADEGVVKPGPENDLSLGNLNVTTTPAGNIELINQLGGLINGVNTWLVTPLLTSTVKPLLAGLTTTLKGLVGLTVAGSTYTLMKDSTTCQSPRLAG